MNITDNAMSSDITPHTALRTAQGWELSYLPDRVLDHNQAVTGMMLAETIASDPHKGPLIACLSAEVGLTPDAARRRVERHTA